jgi:hypothetical protein
MEFMLAATGGLIALTFVFIAIGKWYPSTPAEFLDWKPTRSYEDEVQLELDDIDQMLEAQNERRRRTGRPELSEDDIRAQVHAHDAEQQRRQSELKRERGQPEEEI